jgi:hypothetical protein
LVQFSIVFGMRTSIDDFPSLSVSHMRAVGEIRPQMKTAVVQFSDADTFIVALSHLRFPNGGGWSFFICACGRRCRTIRLFEGSLACSGCLRARGFRPRVQLIATHERAAYVVPRRLARLTSASPARLRPRRGRVLDRRVRLEGAIRRSLIVARKHALEEHEKLLKS